MAITPTKGTGTPIKPLPDGINQVVVSDVRDLGVIQGAFGPKYTVAVTFSNQDGEQGARFYTGNPDTKKLSLHEKSNLFADLKGMGVLEKYSNNDVNTAEGIKKSLVGTQAVVISEQYKNQKGYTNAKVKTVTKAAKGQSVEIKGQGVATVTNPITDDDIAF